jgi:succinate dehydrogenase / fumarate reductase membrane anchor subunit
MRNPLHTDIRSPLGRVRGLGTAHSGTDHFWHQRLTAIANIPLVIAAIVILLAVLGRNHAATVQILGSPLVAVILILFVLSITYHMRIGMQVIIEDYVHSGWKMVLVVLNNFYAVAVGLACVFAVLKLSFGV